MNNIFILPNGNNIPNIGFGTWTLREGEHTVEVIKSAIDAGYRHIDTAAMYENEVSVGRAVRECGLPREELFITSKLANPNRSYESAHIAFNQTLERLGLDYVDLFLIHWPVSRKGAENWEERNLETWRAFIEIYKSGRARAIGVSNFLPHHLEALMKTEVYPMVDQIEFHPGYIQEETLRFCHSHGICTQAWSPLGRAAVLEDETLKAIAAKYGKSTAQLSIRWCMQHAVLPLPKSQDPSRMRENIDVYDFIISNEDMNTIDALPQLGYSGQHPDERS